MLIKAAVARAINELSIEEVHLDPPSRHEALVRIRAAGVCHSDLHTLRGELRATPPIVLGHEGAGVVEAVGPGVSRVGPGDTVAITWLPACNCCPTCLAGRPTLCERLAATTLAGAMPDGTLRHRARDGLALKPYLSSATMAEYAVIHENGLVPVPDGIPFEVAAIVGCGVMTGVGAVLNQAQVRPGSSAAVIGCGGVGLSSLLGCKLAGCDPIIAVDVAADKLDRARSLGASHAVNSRQSDALEQIHRITGSGSDCAFDSVGIGSTIALALQCVRPDGTAVVMGMGAVKEEIAIPPAALVFGNRRLMGSFAGSGRPLSDLPRLMDLYRAGRLDLDALITRRYPLAAALRALEDLEAGRVARGVVMIGD